MAELLADNPSGEVLYLSGYRAHAVDHGFPNFIFRSSAFPGIFKMKLRSMLISYSYLSRKSDQLAYLRLQ